MIEALEIAFQEIDNETTSRQTNNSHLKNDVKLQQKPKIVKDFEELQAEIDPFYENIDEILEEKSPNKVEPILKRPPKGETSPHKTRSPKSQKEQHKQQLESANNEPYYQTPNAEPYYEVPKTKPVPLYENVQMRGPPREKPPPPPVDAVDDEQHVNMGGNAVDTNEDIFKRINSTKRIKKEIWNKRSSFLGIDGPDDSVFELNVAPPPDMSAFLEEERRLQRQLIMKTGFSDNSDTGREIEMKKIFLIQI